MREAGLPPDGCGMTDGEVHPDGADPEEAKIPPIEDSLRETQARFDALFEGVQAGILIIDSDAHRIVDANLTALKAVGREREQVVGARCHKFVCPADEGRCPVSDLGQTVDNSERFLLTASGDRRSIIKTVRPMTIGGHAYLLESFLDITERKRAEQQLRESEERYRDLFENATDIVYTTDLAGRFTELNRVGREILGYSRGEITGLDILADDGPGASGTSRAGTRPASGGSVRSHAGSGAGRQGRPPGDGGGETPPHP